MNRITEAAPIILTEAERTDLEGLARSGKTEHRLRQRARIVLLAAEGLATRAIGRKVGCTTGTASKWRVRYAGDWLASTKRAIVAARPNIRPTRRSAFCGFSICDRLTATAAGADR